MKLFAAFFIVKWEGETFLGVFSTLEKAIEASETHVMVRNGKEGLPLNWSDSRGGWQSRNDGDCWYYIQDYELDKKIYS